MDLSGYCSEWSTVKKSATTHKEMSRSWQGGAGQAQGLPHAKIQLISGHASKKRLEVYQHLSLSAVQPGYEKAVKNLEI